MDETRILDDALTAHELYLTPAPSYDNMETRITALAPRFYIWHKGIKVIPYSLTEPEIWRHLHALEAALVSKDPEGSHA